MQKWIVSLCKQLGIFIVKYFHLLNANLQNIMMIIGEEAHQPDQDHNMLITDN